VQCGRERAREMIVVGFVLLTAGAHAAARREARADAARSTALRLAGDYAVQAAAPAGALELALKSGFAAHLRRPGAARVGLRVARVRAPATEIDESFVPIGPTVELTAGAGPADLSYVADHFRVRRGQRLVLAVEQAGCAPQGRCWSFAPATYEHGRCVARGVETAGLRLQFGSLQ
jgi:hypothetical protein